MGIIGWLVDGAAIMNQIRCVGVPMGPMRGHDPGVQGRKLSPASGYEIAMYLARGTDAQREMVQESLNRWWWPSLMMFGPHDADSAHSEQSMAWKIKRFSNDALRQKFIDATVPQAEFFGTDLARSGFKVERR